MKYCIKLLSCLFFAVVAEAFVPQQELTSAGWMIGSTTSPQRPLSPVPNNFAKRTTSRRMMFPPVDTLYDATTTITNSFTSTIVSPAAALHNTLLLATIDGDISKMSDNEFAPVFMGGIIVMFGGLLSAIFVGTIVNARDLSASIVADSYAQAGADDEEFWKGLSEEERKKTKELLQRIKDNNNNGKSATNGGGETPVAEISDSETAPPAPAVEPEKSSKQQQVSKKVGMFDDYGD